MHIRNLSIRNFRGLDDIHAEFGTKVSVIVGPNAAGKTTILEAIRLVKALMAPRTPAEPQQIMFGLGATSPHSPQRIRFQAVARDAAKPVVVSCVFDLTDEEIDALVEAQNSIAISLVQAQNGAQFAQQDQMIPFLNSPFGKERLRAALQEVDAGISEVKRARRCKLEITWDAQTGPQATSDPLEAQFMTFLERRLPPNLTSFTYFPADRALPAGEQQVQLGGPDSNQQLESYNSQPQLKFTRLKNLIFSAAIFSNADQQKPGAFKQDFERIFNGVLKGRSLDHIEINDIGLLSAMIKDTDSGRIFDIDGMSSGEKGLILTFLLLQRSVIKDGIVLLDEPELHLNPAVCKDLLSNLCKEFVATRNLQFIICSHSPEILAGAFDNDVCALYHLVSPTNLSKVRIQDEGNLDETLRRLGANESESLLYKGMIFVEGVDDIAVLEAGFGNLLRRYKLKQKQGRHEVEKAIRDLQELEKKGESTSKTFFIFDHDDAPTDLKSTDAVRILQWSRRCLENYFIDIDAMTSVLTSPDFVHKPLADNGEVTTKLKQLAFNQLPELAARQVYDHYGFVGIGVRRDDIRGKSTADISQTLLGRIQQLKEQLAKVDDEKWAAEFEGEVKAATDKMRQVWEGDWKEKCDGKRLIEDLAKSVTFRTNQRVFKVRLIKEMALSQSEGWKAVEQQLKELLE